MKKILFICFCLFACISVKANEIGHFCIDLSSDDVAVSSIVNSFSSYIDIANGSTFELFRDTTDQLGIRHQSYQQYLQGVRVQSYMVLVHSKNNKVLLMNGAVLTNSSAPSNIAPRISRRKAKMSANVSVDEKEMQHVIINVDGRFYSVYKILSPATLETIYVDANSGEVIYRESAIRSADVILPGYTLYNGWQNMTMYESNGFYYYLDDGRNIATMAAGQYGPSQYYTSEEYLLTLPEDIQNKFIHAADFPADELQQLMIEYIYSPMASEYISDSCSIIYSTEDEMYTPILTSITISSAASSWWYDIWDTKPDIYCKIYDASGNLVYTTATKNDCSFPLTFTIPSIRLYTEGYTIKIYDEDATSDSYGGSISLTDTKNGTKTWSGTNTSGSLVIDQSYIEYADIHWGMQKTIDFYRSTFGRNSYDGNGSIVINIAFPPKDDVLFPTMPNNAAAQHTFEPYYMFYGAGDWTNMYPVVDIDVMAHEFTHMVTSKNGNGGLDYRGESGALNESFSDCLAMGVCKSALDILPWTIGSDLMIKAPNLRSLSDPKNSGGANGDTLKGAQPDTYNGDCWKNTSNPNATNDNGGVHTNSGVQNYWFYLLSEGGADINDLENSYSVNGIGLDKALQITYRNLIYYLIPCATYEDARNGSIQAAIDLYGRDSQEHQSVMNAWHAVGVGDRYIDPSEDFELKPGKYVIVANRAKEGDRNWYYMTSDLGTASTKRFQAVSTGTESMDAIDITDLEDKYVWTLEADGSNWMLKNGTQYVTWTSGNSANLGTTAKTLTFDVADNQVLAHFNDGSAERYLSLNATTNNNYFAFYSGTNQIEQLFFLPYENGTTPPVESERYIVLAQRSATSNWLYMTSDLGTASNKRYQAVDAGTSILSSVVNKDLADKYYWEIDGNKLKTAAGYSTWTSGNSANLDATGKELTIQQQTDGTYTFSFVDGDNTRYLALNKTAGNDYFAYYIGTNQIYRLTLVKEGASGTITAIEDILPEEQSATKFLYNGQIYIRRGDKIYTLQGQLVK